MKILIVDDSKVTRRLVSRCIRDAGLGTHTFEEASDGLDALKVVAQTAPDLVVTDWNMPHMTGIDFVTQLRRGGNRVKVGFITSEGTDQMRSEARACGADFFITKPFNAETIRTALTGILS